MAFAIMRHKKHKLDGGLNVALQHLYRERETPNASNLLSNHFWAEDGDQNTKSALTRLHSQLKRVKESTGRNIRKDAVVAIEYLITASPEWFSDDPSDRRAQGITLSEKGREWLKEQFPDGEIIAAQCHMDESTPHLSAFVVPTYKTKDGKIRLSARNFLGKREQLVAQQNSFASHVEAMGLKRGMEGSQATHESVNRFYGKLKRLGEKKSNEAEEYRAKIADIEQREDGKADLVALATDMANDLESLEINYHRELLASKKEAEAVRLINVKEDHQKELSEMRVRHMKAMDKLRDSKDAEIMSTLTDLENTKTKLELIEEMLDQTRKKLAESELEMSQVSAHLAGFRRALENLYHKPKDDLNLTEDQKKGIKLLVDAINYETDMYNLKEDEPKPKSPYPEPKQQVMAPHML